MVANTCFVIGPDGVVRRIHLLEGRARRYPTLQSELKTLGPTVAVYIYYGRC